jgi:hypothetical protein
MDFVVITAANDLYINTIVDFIKSYPLDFTSLIVYNLGLEPGNLHRLQTLNQEHPFIFKTFEYDNYPEYVNINKWSGLNCSYAFKPIILYNEANTVSNKNKIIIWMDSANRFHPTHINNICSIVKSQGIYTPVSANKGTIESIELNHHSVIKAYGLSDSEHKEQLQSISANLIGFDYTSNAGFGIIKKWYTDSLNETLIMPKGTNRNNNRQDQTLLSVLIFLYEKYNKVVFNKTSVGVSFWNKKDDITVDKIYHPFKLFDRHTRKQLAIIYCKDINDAITVYADRKNIRVPVFLQHFVVTNG